MKEPKVVMQNPYYMLITNMRGWLFFNFEENGQELRENGPFKVMYLRIQNDSLVIKRL